MGLGLRRDPQCRRAAWPGIGGYGVLWFGLYMITLNWGAREVDAGTAAMVVTIGPILIALLGGYRPRTAAVVAASGGEATRATVREPWAAAA